jgi:ATPase family associated with various cellular activities (AAA)
MNTTATAIDPILDACRAGHQTLLVSGRSLFDLHVNERGEVRPLRHSLMRRAKEEFGMGALQFNLAIGARWNWDSFGDGERQTFERKLQEAKVPLSTGIAAANDRRLAPHERAFLLLGSLQRSLELGRNLPPILMISEFGDDIAPDPERGGTSDWIVQISEMLQLLANDYQRRRHQLALVVTGTPERMDRRVVNCLRPVPLCQPDREEKAVFITSLRKLNSARNASYATGLDDQTVANLTARTPNQSLEEAFLESSRTGRPISHQSLVERKRADVVALSEGTLSLLDTERVRNIRLVGRTIEKPLALLNRWALGLKEGNPHTPTNVILAGAPSSAKTDLALLTAELSQTPTYSLVSPKGSLVGQTERLVRLQFRVFKELSPAFGVIDEITEAFPTERNSANLDSGASSAVTAEMLSALADSSRAGRTLLIATTNCPWKVGAAMASRFLFVPVLSAVEDDYPAILCSLASGLLPHGDWNPSDQAVRDAAQVFYCKGASPRVMRTLISAKIATSDGAHDSRLLQRAAAACAPQDPRDRASAEYADLFAIRVCSDLEMLPWHGRISNYPLPEYLREIVSEQDGSIDLDHLNRRINELEPHVNV